MVIKFPDENSQPIKHSPHIAGHEFIVMHMHTHFSLAIVSVPTHKVINKISRKMTALSLSRALNYTQSNKGPPLSTVHFLTPLPLGLFLSFLR